MLMILLKISSSKKLKLCQVFFLTPVKNLL